MTNHDQCNRYYDRLKEKVDERIKQDAEEIVSTDILNLSLFSAAECCGKNGKSQLLND